MTEQTVQVKGFYKSRPAAWVKKVLKCRIGTIADGCEGSPLQNLMLAEAREAKLQIPEKNGL